jgi:hypothetical protein
MRVDAMRLFDLGVLVKDLSGGRSFGVLLLRLRD